MALSIEFRAGLEQRQMRVSTSIFVLVGALSNIPITSHAADAVPDFDVIANCSIGLLDSRETGETLNTCTQDEQRAKRQLTQEWSRFVKVDRLRCIQETGIGGTPSYVELQTCLQMAADNPARSIQGFDGQMRTNTNQAGPGLGGTRSARTTAD